MDAYKKGWRVYIYITYMPDFANVICCKFKLYSSAKNAYILWSWANMFYVWNAMLVLFINKPKFSFHIVFGEPSCKHVLEQIVTCPGCRFMLFSGKIKFVCCCYRLACWLLPLKLLIWEIRNKWSFNIFSGLIIITINKIEY